MILIALGSNLPSQYGGPDETLEAAKIALQAHPDIELAQVSRTWITEPVPRSDQPFYRNAVACVKTSLSARELLVALHGIESGFGRVRKERNEARPLDMDLIAYGDLILDKPDIVLPHPRMQDRAFVLVPLSEVAADWIHPVFKKTTLELLKELDDDHGIYAAEEKAA